MSHTQTEQSSDGLVPADAAGHGSSTEEALDVAASVRLSVAIDAFEGPLDLLLHLVRANDMDILDIPVAEISRQYNDYLNRMQQLDLEVASEYLVMAATLTYIKSRMLLPPDPSENEEEDPRAELSRQLLDYERYKRAAEELEALESSQDLILARPGPPPRELAGEFTIRADLTDLVRAFERVLSRLEQDDLQYVVHREDYRVEDLMKRWVGLLSEDEVLSLRPLLNRCRTRLERVVLFLALLELVRLGAVAVHQPDFSTDPRIERRADASSSDAADGEGGDPDPDLSEPSSGVEAQT